GRVRVGSNAARREQGAEPGGVPKGVPNPLELVSFKGGVSPYLVPCHLLRLEPSRSVYSTHRRVAPRGSWCPLLGKECLGLSGGFPGVPGIPRARLLQAS